MSNGKDKVTNENTLTSISLTGTDPDGDTLTYIIVSSIVNYIVVYGLDKSSHYNTKFSRWKFFAVSYRMVSSF
ncbi:hypothetical protein HY745_05565 [Candidatus Desantisbacteria bacterium]|nr:hypothetical protein [Candidatus Desantisbacteria bacterium]